MNDYLCRHIDNDDPRHYAFARTSNLPIDYFAESWWTRFARWLAKVKPIRSMSK